MPVIHQLQQQVGILRRPLHVHKYRKIFSIFAGVAGDIRTRLAQGQPLMGTKKGKVLLVMTQNVRWFMTRDRQLSSTCNSQTYELRTKSVAYSDRWTSTKIQTYLLNIQWRTYDTWRGPNAESLGQPLTSTKKTCRPACEIESGLFREWTTY